MSGTSRSVGSAGGVHLPSLLLGNSVKLRPSICMGFSCEFAYRNRAPGIPLGLPTRKARSNGGLAFVGMYGRLLPWVLHL